MRLLVHLVRADVRRFRWLLAGWVLIEILNTVFTGARPVLADDPRMLAAVDLLGTVLLLTHWLGMILLVPLVVQTHPLVGSDAFWMTRPIPPRTLFSSKVLLLGIAFIAVPALCEVVLMTASRVPIGEIVLVALQTTLFQSLWLAFVMMLSATTRNLARFVLVAGGMLLSLILLMSIGITVATRNMPDAPELIEVTGRSVSGVAPGVVSLLLLITAVVVPLILQYHTRLTPVSVGALVAAVGVVILVALMWPWREHTLPVPAWANRESALQLLAESATGEFRPRESWSHLNRTDDWQIGSAHLRVRGVEEGWLVTVRLAESTVQFDSGATLTTAGNGYSSAVPFESVDDFPAQFVTRQVLGVGRVWRGQPGPSGPQLVPAIVVSQADFTKDSGAAGTYRGRFLVDPNRIEIAATLPLQAGAEYRDRRRRLRIDQVIPRPQAASIRIRQFMASTMFDSGTLPLLSFYLRNRDASEAVEGSHGAIGMSPGVGIPLMFVGGPSGEATNGFSVTSGYIGFRPYNSMEDAVEITADWLSRAELVIVRTVPSGSVTRTVEIPGFEIRAAPPEIGVLQLR